MIGPAGLVVRELLSNVKVAMRNVHHVTTQYQIVQVAILVITEPLQVINVFVLLVMRNL